MDGLSRLAPGHPIVPTGSAVELYSRLVASGPVQWEPEDPDDAADLAALEEAGLVRQTPRGVEAVSPFVPMNALLRAELEKLTHTHQTAASFERAWQHRPDLTTAVDVVSGAASTAAFEQILHDAASVHAFNRMPSHRLLTIAPGALDILARGTTISAIYDVALLSDPRGLKAARTCIEAGENARVLPGVPMSMLVTDSTASISLPGSTGEVPDRLLIHAPRVLNILKAVFDAFWSKAIPISADGEEAPGREENIAMLALLATGLTDHAIGRELGISERTVRRRVSNMQTLLGAQTRFQLGVQAVRQGWIPEP